MTLKSIEKYRAAYDTPAGYPWVRRMIEEIEAEVGERYVERRECEALPASTDARCVVVRGDCVKEFGYWKCSVCGCECFEGAKYCMSCGAKAVSGGMTLKSLEYLRNNGWRHMDDESYAIFKSACNDVQAEVDERYMLLPVDADGVPIHCGERMKLDNGHEGEVWLIGAQDIMMSDHTCFDWAKSRHAKPDAVRELLLDFYGDTHGITAEERDELVDEYAERIRGAVSAE